MTSFSPGPDDVPFERGKTRNSVRLYGVTDAKASVIARTAGTRPVDIKCGKTTEDIMDESISEAASSSYRYVANIFRGSKKLRIAGGADETQMLRRLAHTLYVCADASLTENHSLAEAAKLVPKGVICLLSALRFHELTTENPAEVWIAIPRGGRPPKSGAPALRVGRGSPGR